MSSLSIRPATRDDVPLLLEFIRGIAVYEKLEHQVEATHELLERELFGPQPAAEAILAFMGDLPAAYAVFFHNFSTFLGRRGLYLEDVFVRPEFRRRGVGQRLLKHLAQIAVDRGCGRFEWAVLDWNGSAIQFYEDLGAHVLPDWRICRLTGDALTNLAGDVGES